MSENKGKGLRDFNQIELTKLGDRVGGPGRLLGEKERGHLRVLPT